MLFRSVFAAVADALAGVEQQAALHFFGLRGMARITFRDEHGANLAFEEVELVGRNFLRGRRGRERAGSARGEDCGEKRATCVAKDVQRLHERCAIRRSPGDGSFRGIWDRGDLPSPPSRPSRDTKCASNPKPLQPRVAVEDFVDDDARGERDEDREGDVERLRDFEFEEDDQQRLDRKSTRLNSSHT